MINAFALLFSVFLPLSETSEGATNFTASQPFICCAADTTISESATSTPITGDRNDSIDPANLIAFAQTLKGTPYRYACSDPAKGFDCSGFVMYVFNHFQMRVPRSSIDFTYVGKEIDLESAMPGDVILFTGTNASIRKVGHVGIITQASDTVVFIHASSGKTHAVTETALNLHYKKRFIKVVRMLQ